MTAVPAAADPLGGPCEKMEFTGQIILQQDNDIEVVVDANGASVGPTAKYFQHNKGDTTRGTVTGGLSGGANNHTIDFNANWNQGPGAGLSNHYTGTVNNDGSASGTTVNNLGTPNGWTSTRLARCA